MAMLALPPLCYGASHVFLPVRRALPFVVDTKLDYMMIPLPRFRCFLSAAVEKTKRRTVLFRFYFYFCTRQMQAKLISIPAHLLPHLFYTRGRVGVIRCPGIPRCYADGVSSVHDGAHYLPYRIKSTQPPIDMEVKGAFHRTNSQPPHRLYTPPSRLTGPVFIGRPCKTSWNDRD